VTAAGIRAGVDSVTLGDSDSAARALLGFQAERTTTPLAEASL
jgi:hypothetical protein